MKKIYLGFIGAGGINFGDAEGPWNHSKRIAELAKEKKFDIEVVAITDINEKRMDFVLSREKKKNPGLYANTKLYTNYETMLEKEEKLNAVLLGVSPHVRGSMKNPMELNIISKGIDLFVEKPVSSVEPEQFKLYVEKVEQTRKNTKSRIDNKRPPRISVGYMFRYHPLVSKAKKKDPIL